MVIIDIFVLISYVTAAVGIMIYLTGGEIDRLVMFIAGFAVAAIGTLITILFDQGRK